MKVYEIRFMQIILPNCPSQPRSPAIRATTKYSNAFEQNKFAYKNIKKVNYL